MKKLILIFIFAAITFCLKAQHQSLWYWATQYYQLGDSTVEVFGDDTLTSPVMVRGIVEWYLQNISADSAEYSDTSGYSLYADTANYSLKADSSNYTDTSGYSLKSDSANYSDTTERAFNSDTADYVDTAQFALKADSVLYADTSGYSLKSDSSNFADTSSYALNAVKDSSFVRIDADSGYFGYVEVGNTLLDSTSVETETLTASTEIELTDRVSITPDGSSTKILSETGMLINGDRTLTLQGGDDWEQPTTLISVDGGTSPDIQFYVDGTSWTHYNDEWYNSTDSLAKRSEVRDLITASSDSVLISSTDTITLRGDTLDVEGKVGLFSRILGKVGSLFEGDTVKVTSAFSINGGDVRTTSDTINAKTWFESTPFDSATISKIYGNIIRENLLVVDKTNGNFTTLEGALDSIATAGSDSLNRWVIDIGVGFFNENNPLNIPQYTTIKSVGNINSTVITPQNSGDVFRLSDICVIEGISVIGGDNAFAFDTVGNASRITNIIINDCDTALSMSNGTLYVQDLFIASDGDKMDCGFYQEGGSLTAIGIGINGQDSIGNIFDINKAGTITTITNLLTFSANIDTAITANDSANIVVNTSSIVYAKNGIISTDYSSVRYNSNSHFNIQENYIFSDNTSRAAGFANTDQNDIALELKGQEMHIGSPEEGFEVCLGEGDSYADKILVYEYNGSTYTNVSDSAKRIDGYNVDFPNTSVNTAIYIASDYNDSAKHDGYKLTMTDSMTIGGGEVVLEYWNGAWVEFNAMVTDGDAPFAYHAKEYLEQTQGTHTRYNIEMTNDDWIANDIMSYGSDKKWVRLRIATSITTSPKIDQIKLHPSRLEVNADGYPESFGNARNTQILQLNIGSGQPIEGNMQSQDIYVDENIGVGYLNNRFTATGDILGFPINFPDNIDTGCPINLVLSGRATSAASIQWTIRYVIVTPDGTLYTTEPAASGNAKSVLTTARATVIGDNELFTVSLDVSEAIPSRQGGFGDQLWITINPTTLSGSFDLTNIGAEYWTWSEGGHY